MKFSAQDSETLELNLTPLIDVVFLLLIFFMVTTNFEQKKSEIQISLPEASGQPPQSKDFIIEIGIDSLGRYFVNNRVLVNKKVTTLMKAIQQTIGNSKNKRPHLIISSDKNAPYQAVVSAMDAANQLGLHQFSLATKQSKKEN